MVSVVLYVICAWGVNWMGRGICMPEASAHGMGPKPMDSGLPLLSAPCGMPWSTKVSLRSGSGQEPSALALGQNPLSLSRQTVVGELLMSWYPYKSGNGIPTGVSGMVIVQSLPSELHTGAGCT